MSFGACSSDVSRINNAAGFARSRLLRTFALTLAVFLFTIPAVLPPDVSAQSIRQAVDTGPAVEESVILDLDGAGP